MGSTGQYHGEITTTSQIKQQPDWCQCQEPVRGFEYIVVVLDLFQHQGAKPQHQERRMTDIKASISIYHTTKATL